MKKIIFALTCFTITIFSSSILASNSVNKILGTNEPSSTVISSIIDSESDERVCVTGYYTTSCNKSHLVTVRSVNGECDPRMVKLILSISFLALEVKCLFDSI